MKVVACIPNQFPVQVPKGLLFLILVLVVSSDLSVCIVKCARQKDPQGLIISSVNVSLVRG